MSEKHCPSCVCGKRAPVQAQGDHGPGTITWAEHLEAWSRYAARYGSEQSAMRLAQRGGFGFVEIQSFLGGVPKTWEAMR